MRQSDWIAAALAAIVVAGVSTAASAADTTHSITPPAHQQMTDDGPILVTNAGMTLYTLVADYSSPGKSQCSSTPHGYFSDPTAGFGNVPLPRAEAHQSCAQKWPPLVADANAVAGADWSLIDRPEGSRQWAYLGHPLYTSIKDRVPGDRNGALSIGQVNIFSQRFMLAAVPLNLPPGLKLVPREEGLVLATLNERPVYTPRAHARNACAGCEGVFEPIAAPAISNVSGHWTIISAGAGRQQYAFDHKSLYAAPTSQSDREILDSGAWDLVVFRSTAPIPAEIGRHLSLLGDVYTSVEGRTLYAFTCGTPAGDAVRCDDPGDAAEYWVMVCGDAAECARRWHPYAASANAHPAGPWTIVEVAYPMFTDGTGFTYPPDSPRVRAWAYRGLPVYTYYRDQAPGDIWGDGVRLHSFSGFYALRIPGRDILD